MRAATHLLLLACLRLWLAPTLAWAAPAVLIRPSSVEPGGVLLVEVQGAEGRAARGQAFGKLVSFFPAGAAQRALMAVPLDASPGPSHIQVLLGDPEAPFSLQTRVQVLEAKFDTRELNVDDRFVKISRAAKKQIQVDKVALRQAYEVAAGPPLFGGRFARPLDATVTGHFGDRRTFNGALKSRHLGIDFDGKVGDIVRASNDGVVRLVRDCYYSGKTVLVSHGAGVFTSYFHLSSAEVTVGQTLTRGEVIGRIGDSGRVTGPHLHFAAKVGGSVVNPQALLALDLEPFDDVAESAPEAPPAAPVEAPAALGAAAR